MSCENSVGVGSTVLTGWVFLRNQIPGYRRGISNMLVGYHHEDSTAKFQIFYAVRVQDEEHSTVSLLDYGQFNCADLTSCPSLYEIFH